MSLFILTCPWIYLWIWIETLGNNYLFWIHVDFFQTVLYWNTRGMQSKAVNELILKLSKAFSTCHQTITVTNYIWELCRKPFVLDSFIHVSSEGSLLHSRMFSLKIALNVNNCLDVRLLINTHSCNFFQPLLMSFIWP